MTGPLVGTWVAHGSTQAEGHGANMSPMAAEGMRRMHLAEESECFSGDVPRTPMCAAPGGPVMGFVGCLSDFGGSALSVTEPMGDGPICVCSCFWARSLQRLKLALSALPG